MLSRIYDLFSYIFLVSFNGHISITTRKLDIGKNIYMKNEIYIYMTICIEKINEYVFPKNGAF